MNNFFLNSCMNCNRGKLLVFQGFTPMKVLESTVGVKFFDSWKRKNIERRQ